MMSKLIFSFLAACCFSIHIASAQMLAAQNGSISFYSKTPMEDISAKNVKVAGLLNIANRQIVIRAMMKDFDFPNNLMEEHFNENYVESDKFPKSTFSGTINEAVDFSKPGSYPATATGTLEIHGVSKPKTISGTLVVNADKSVTLSASYPILLEDHDIKRPSIVMMKIAEKVDCKADLVFKPKEK